LKDFHETSRSPIRLEWVIFFIFCLNASKQLQLGDMREKKKRKKPCKYIKALIITPLVPL